MPNPNHCIICEKPTMNKNSICDSCKESLDKRDDELHLVEHIPDLAELKEVTISTLIELASKPLSSAENISAMTRLLELIYKIQRESGAKL